MKKNIVKISLVTAMVLGAGAYAGLIDTNTDEGWNLSTQYGFTGWNLENVEVKIVDVNDFNTSLPGTSFNEDTGLYSEMTYGMSFESEISTGGEVRGLLHGKNWPVGEPAGIKIINGDMNTKNGKPENCIMTTSYLEYQDMNDINSGSGYLDTTDGEPNPTICSSPFQTHKRFKINMMPTMVANPDVSGYGQPVELVFNLVDGDMSDKRYQVFQKINNYTGKRLDGYTIEVLKADGTKDNNLTLSIGLLEHRDKDGLLDNTNIWDVEDMANFSHGLWGPQTFEVPPHFPTDGFFDSVRAGFVVDPNGHGTSTLVGGPTTLGSNYEALFGLWLPSKWAPLGIFWDDDENPLTDAVLMAFWGTIPNAPAGTAPAWHKGQKDNWAEPTDQELVTWTIDPWFEIGLIEDTLNLGLNYIVNVGDNSAIDGNFTVRITPRVAVDQTKPNYIEDDNVTYIEPPTSYTASAGVVTISPEPTFTPGTDLYVGVADADLNEDATQAEEVIITVKSDTGDSETVTLTETDVDSGVFSGTLPSEISSSAPTANNGVMTVIEDTVVTATYVDEHYGNTGIVETLTASTTAKTPVAPTPPAASSGGGGCTFNPNSKNFDMTFLLMMALGMLYPFRRRFIK